MRFLATVIGVTVVFLHVLMQPLIADFSTDAERSLEEFLKIMRHLLEGCKVKSAEETENFVSGVQRCLKNKTVASLDRMLHMDVIPVMSGVELVRYATLTSPTNGSAASSRLLSGQGHVLDWVAELFRSHVIRVQLEEFQGRVRHHYRHLFPLMMFAFMKMLVILVPLGFQFMAVISGKALLLSKMALALASAQAMKKVTSAWFDVYHAPHPTYYHNIHRSYHLQPALSHVDLLHAPPLQQNFQGFEPTLTDLAHSPTFTHTSPTIGQDPSQQLHHEPVSQEYQFVFTGTDHKPIQYPPVPSVYDLPVEDGEDRMDRQHGNSKSYNHYQRNRSKRL